MIAFASGPPLVRIGEVDVGGRRAAARALPFSGEACPGPFRFDPVERRMVMRPESVSAAVGPADPEEWRRAIRRAPAGPVLVGPSADAEPLRLAFRAAAEGVVASGRAAYVLDPDPRSLEVLAAPACVLLFAGIPDDRMRRTLAQAASRGLTAGVLFPVVPGWTSDVSAAEEASAIAGEAGARFLVPVPIAGDGESRRRIVEVRSIVEPERADEFFDRVHHSDWDAECEAGVTRVLSAAAARGLAGLPPRPAGRGEPLPNARAAARLEELAFGEPHDEHRFSLRLAAARWIDEWGRDLSPVVAEGNFRKIFPFGADVAREAEEALGGPRP